MSLKYTLQTGAINGVHPAGLFVLAAILAIGVLLKKAFCSWLCPVGTLSEFLWLFGQRLFKRSFQPPHWLDIPLRGLKYFLLAFFVLAILRMDPPNLELFLQSPYNKMADVKMYLFFANIGSFALWTILGLMFLSMLIKNFWCRFLCPYGALLGVASLFSPAKITRNASTCIDCVLCTKACPAAINVHSAGRVSSDECTGCYRCVEACPVKNTLQMKTVAGDVAIPSWVFGTLVAGIFVACTGMAMLTGHWRNEIGKEEYARRFQQIESALYQHNRGSVPDDGPHD
jgi:polyferredoxin